MILRTLTTIVFLVPFRVKIAYRANTQKKYPKKTENGFNNCLL